MIIRHCAKLIGASLLEVRFLLNTIKNRHRRSDVGFLIRLIGKRLKAVTARRPQSGTRRRPLRLQNSPQESFADGASLLEVRFLLNTIKNRHRRSDVGFLIRLIGKRLKAVTARRPQSGTRRRPLRLQNSPQESFADGASLLEVRFLLNTIKNRHRRSDVGFLIRLIGIEPTTTRRRRPVLYPLSYRRRYCKRYDNRNLNP